MRPKGATKGTKEKDGKGQGRLERQRKDKGKSEPCYFFSETEDGCNRGQQCPRYHRTLKPEDKKCYVCGNTKHMVGECDRPKRDDSSGKGSPKGDKGKADKGKSNSKFDAGKGKPQIKQLTEGQSPEANAAEGRELRQQKSDPKEL